MARYKVIYNANLYTPEGNTSHRGEQMGNIKHLHDAAIVIDEDVIEYVGPMDGVPTLPLEDTDMIDAGGRAVIPGFVDSHTHLVFGGYRADEFGWRLKGDTYMSIMERGGGIQSTVNVTRRSTVQELVDNARWLLGKMHDMGVTTVEAKTGYGLDTETELKMLDVIEELNSDPDRQVEIVLTFMPAHAVPAEFKGRTDEYIDEIIGKMLPKAEGRAKFFDIFTEKNVFEIDESRRLLQAARDAGFKLKLHADEIVPLGGAELAAEMDAVSADHLLHISDAGIEAMARKGVVATLLPLTAFALKEEFAPARRLIDAGCAVALATDLNPGSCFSGSIPLTIALACVYMGMTVEETLTALTLNGAAALDMADRTGSIEPGKSADMLILHFDTLSALPYYVGMNCVDTVISKGRVSKI